ncbi:hypothetical protein C8J57DRAFT_1214380 [Mycena rebaudengoi]|nr:hypothetical protein C8J57DRAFT_1214380 [Mycena rebaudengoi]
MKMESKKDNVFINYSTEHLRVTQNQMVQAHCKTPSFHGEPFFQQQFAKLMSFAALGVQIKLMPETTLTGTPCRCSIDAPPACGVGPTVPSSPVSTITSGSDLNSSCLTYAPISSAPSSTSSPSIPFTWNSDPFLAGAAQTPASTLPINTTPSTPATPTVPPPITPDIPCKNPNSRAATDVYFFIRPLKTNVPPEQLPQAESLNTTTPELLMEKPSMKDYPYLGCRLCEHWQDKHRPIYYPISAKLGLKHSSDETQGSTKAAFTLEGWIDRLIRWLVVDDQSINVVDYKEFRNFVLFGRDETEKDLPHRTAVMDRILKQHAEVHKALVEEFKGKHYGENFAQIAFDILKKGGILHQSGVWTLDSAPNNNMFMVHLGRLLAAEPGLVVQFDAEGNRVRCFLHVINIAAQTIIKELKENPWTPVLTSASSMEFNELIAYANTRWSSTFKMNDRVMELYPAVQCFLKHPKQESLAHLLFTEEQFQHYIGVGIAKIQEYIRKGCKSRIYVLTMIINLTMKLSWIQDHWPEEDTQKAEEWLLEAMTSFVTAKRQLNVKKAPTSSTALLSTQPISTSSHTAIAQASGFSRLTSMTRVSRQKVSLPKTTSTAIPLQTESPFTSSQTTNAVSEPEFPVLPVAEVAELERVVLEDDWHVAHRELNAYKNEPLEVSDTSTKFNLVCYWDVSGM